MAKKNTDEVKNDADYLATLHEEYYSRLSRYIFVRINDKSESEDLASEVFLKALQSLNRILLFLSVSILLINC